MKKNVPSRSCSWEENNHVRERGWRATGGRGVREGHSETVTLQMRPEG